MKPYYVRRAIDALQEEGFIEVIKRSKNFLWKKLLGNEYGFKINTFKSKIVNEYRYGFPPDPYKTIRINPKDTKYILRRDNNGNLLIPNVHRGGLGQIRAGDWDSPKFRMNIEEHPHTGIMYFVERFENGKAMEETHRYQYLIEKYNKQNIYKDQGFDSVDDYVISILQDYESLFKEIEKEGYKENHRGKNRKPLHRQPVQDRLETLVTIDRWGNINHWDGQHRKGIARVLNLEIPAHVVCRHEQWQELRDDIYHNGLSEEHNKELRDHPDLQDVLNENT